MNKKVSAAMIIISFICMPPQVFSGDLNPASPIGSSNGYTLEDIWNHLQNGTPGSTGPFFEPSAGPEVGTGKTMNEIMSIAPEQDNISGADPSEVISGKTYWGVQGGKWGSQTGTAVFPAHIPKTGQTTTYASGDDGELEYGVAWPNSRFTDNFNGTVTDKLTDLIWLKNASCIGLRTWAEALDDCSTLTSGSCGLSDDSTAEDWRLPNDEELMSLLHYGYQEPAVSNTAGTGQWVNNDPFTNIQSYYWTSTTDSSTPSDAWTVDLYYGSVMSYDKSSARNVWPVSGGR